MLGFARAKAYKLIILQLIIVVILSVLWWIFKDFKAGYSALFGGFACIIPSIFFIRKFFSSKKRTPQKIIRDFYLGELTKLFLSAILLVLIVKFMGVLLLPTLTGYIGAYLAIWFMPLFFMK